MSWFYLLIMLLCKVTTNDGHCNGFGNVKRKFVFFVRFIYICILKVLRYGIPDNDTPSRGRQFHAP